MSSNKKLENTAGIFCEIKFTLLEKCFNCNGKNSQCENYMPYIYFKQESAELERVIKEMTDFYDSFNLKIFN
jgi:hypothetical protein